MANSWTEKIAALQDKREYAELNWEGSFDDYLELVRNNPRVTRTGKFLRKTSLDELPQLLNVVLGDMSLVGPRPIIRDEAANYGRHIRWYLAVRPGMTGLWQVSGRNDVSYRRRVAMDVNYVRNACPLLDLKLLLRTVPVVLFGSGAY